jgi:hypothetical protein
MRTLGLVLLFAVGCGVAPSTDAEPGASTAAADSTKAPKWCLYPTTHLFNGTSQVFTLDRPAAAGDGTAQPVVARSSGFYWHGVLTTLSSDSTESWIIRSSNETDGVHVQGWSTFTTLTLDLGAPQGQFHARTGVVRIHPQTGDDEIVPIGRVDETCPGPPPQG